MVKKKKLSTHPPPWTDERAYRILLTQYTKTAIAEMLGIKKQAITRWTSVPLKYVRPLSEATGISKKNLRPSDFS